MTLAGNRNDERTGTDVSPPRSVFSFSRLALAGVIAAVVAAAANLIIFFVARDALDISFVFPFAGNEPRSLPASGVATMSVIPALLGAGLLWLLARFVRHPLRTFQAAALLILLVSFIPVLTLKDTEMSTRMSLLLMHIVAAAVIVGVLSSSVDRRFRRG